MPELLRDLARGRRPDNGAAALALAPLTPESWMMLHRNMAGPCIARMPGMSVAHNTESARNCLNPLYNSTDGATRRNSRVAFRVLRFAFPALFAPHNSYVDVIRRATPLHHAKAAPCEKRFAWRCVMKLLSRLFAGRRETNLTTALERQRLSRTMPGETGAMAGSRFGFLVN